MNYGDLKQKAEAAGYVLHVTGDGFITVPLLPGAPVKLAAGHSIAGYETMSFEQKRAAQWNRQQQS